MKLNYAKYADGLIPAIIQDSDSGIVLMLGFMNAEAVAATKTSGRVTFFSRSKQQLWTKGETSGNYLEFVSIAADCDKDTLLLKANPVGPVCHTGANTCFGEVNKNFLSELESVIDERRSNPTDDSYVSKLFAKGINKIAQKVGEEAVEVVIAAKDDDIDAFKNESADLFFHYLILLRAKGISMSDVLSVLKERRR
ncbi:MAG TPA: bifunctional phosphoribosyl-AMP cyclohydrolase/phosphoribosyl-ATP diphosphatase HisIE [Pyrinomonadaceae bacterium]|nr:bifunctional phosphoribosyl-AMP cyclohydrolase/phosphoribosyl-ATP diphosphatase HisIE [Pyrinomonadaceae bacterium]